VRDDPVRYPQRPGQERPVGILDDQDPDVDQRRARRQPCPGGGLGERDSGELQREADRGPAAADVVVEVAVEALQPRVEVGRERGHQQVDVQRGETGGAGEPAQP